MSWYPLDTWIVVIGAVSAVACSLVGTFLVLRNMSMMGDAISHAVLPGLAAGYLLTGERASLTMFLAAVLVGVLTAFFIQSISQLGRVDRGASMGIVFTSLFALGLVMIVRAADNVDLDPGCVLYGAIELAPLDRVAVGLASGGSEMEVPRTLLTTSGSLFLNLLVIGLLFKEWKISSFDPELAKTLGYNATRLHYLLMMLVAVTTVAVFEAVGSILVIAMLIVPPACAALLVNRLGTMLVVGALYGVASAVLGHGAALVVPQWLGFGGTSTSGMMAVMGGVLFLLTAFLAPERGLFLTWWRRRQQSPEAGELREARGQGDR